MMGTKERNFQPLPEDISLEDLVPEDNFYRRLQVRVDLSFVRELVEDRYAASGRPSVDPEVFFRLQLVMFYEGIRSERELMRLVSDRLSVRWYVGYDLREPLPDHSSLTRIRERFGLGVFRRFFERVVEECFEAGLVWGEELFFDATKVEADASLDSAGSRVLLEYRLGEHLAGTFSEEALPARDGIDAEVGPADPEQRGDLTRVNAERHRWIEKNGRQERAW
jgi:transposase